MATLVEYANRFKFVKLTREDGILQMRLHTDDGPMRWNRDVQAEIERLGRATAAGSAP